MSREDDEMGEAQHNAQFMNEDGLDALGYYPGQQQYELEHREEVEAREQADAEAAKRAEEALLAEINERG